MTKENKYNQKIQIFVGYNKPDFIYQSDIFHPIFAGNIDFDIPKNALRDNTGDNIAHKNDNYGALTGHYWIWKNYLPSLENLEYIGVCQYRRFLDFNITQKSKICYLPILKKKFNKIFLKYTAENIINKIKEYDIVIPHENILLTSVYDQYILNSPKKDMDIALDILKKMYPEYTKITEEIMQGKTMQILGCFVMKKELFNQWMEWYFSILNELEKQADWKNYKEYGSIRTPAFIIERFFIIWIKYNQEKYNLKILNTSSYLLCETNTEYFKKIIREKIVYLLARTPGGNIIKSILKSIITPFIKVSCQKEK